MPSISVVICVKNQKYELKKSLHSVLAQVERPDEIVIVDASCDDSAKDLIRADLTGKEKYISLREAEAQAYDEQALFEIGLKQAAGEWVAFLVAGDEWNENKISLIKRGLLGNPEADFCATSFGQRVCFSEQGVFANYFEGKFDGSAAFLFFWFAPSAFAVKTRLGLSFGALPAEEAKGLKALYVQDSLSLHYYGAQKDLPLMERLFWQKRFDQIVKMGALAPAVLFCLKIFHGGESNQSFEAFVRNVGFPPELVPSLRPLFGADAQKLANKARQNYLLMRDWLEMKISGRSVADNLAGRGFSSVVIYGAGKHGGILFNELKNSSARVLAWLDKSSAKEDCMGLPVYSPQGLSQDSLKAELSDACVIVTPYLEFDGIAKELEKLEFKNVVSLRDIIQ